MIRESKKDKETPGLATQTSQPQPFASPPTHPGARRISVDDLRLSVDDLRLMDTFLNRRRDMDVDLRSRMASQILARLKAQIEMPDDGRTAEEIIETLARERRETYGG